MNPRGSLLFPFSAVLRVGFPRESASRVQPTQMKIPSPTLPFGGGPRDFPHEHRTHIHLRPCDLGRSWLVPIQHDGRFGIVPKRSEVLVGSLTPSPPPLLISFHPTLVGGAFLGGSSPSAEAGIFKIFSNLRPCDLGCSRQDVHSFGRCCGRVISVAVCCRSNSCLANQLDLYDQFPKFFSKPWPCDLG